MLDYHKISIFNGMEMEILKVESFTPLIKYCLSMFLVVNWC